LHPKADILSLGFEVCFVPKANILSAGTESEGQKLAGISD
jgi:hypothetical protein